MRRRFRQFLLILSGGSFTASAPPSGPTNGIEQETGSFLLTETDTYLVQE